MTTFPTFAMALDGSLLPVPHPAAATATRAKMATSPMTTAEYLFVTETSLKLLERACNNDSGV
jgi:hypothetical protein